MNVREVAEGIWGIELPLPPGHPDQVAVYAMQDAHGRLHLIDAGWPSEEHRAALRTAVDGLPGGFSSVESVTVTHHHADHLGLADWVRSCTGARVGLHAAEQRTIDRLTRPHAHLPPDSLLDELAIPDDARVGIFADWPGQDRHVPVTADVLLSDGDSLPVPGRDARVIHTPGHTGGHLCLVEKIAGVVFTGDHILPTSFGGLDLVGDLGPDALAIYFRSLDRVRELGDVLGLPGHGDPFTDVSKRCEAIRGRFLRRTREASAVVQRMPDSTPWEVAQRLNWRHGWSALRGEPLLHAVIQTRAHMRHVAADRPLV